jgi:DNA-binding HxlR family transcriptional regulator
MSPDIDCTNEICPVSVALNVFGGKWKLQIIWILNKKSLRFGELKRKLPGISEKILIQQLKQLAEDKIVVRNQYPEVPPKVEYHLSDVGKSLLPILATLNKWSNQHLMNDYLNRKSEISVEA